MDEIQKRREEAERKRRIRYAAMIRWARQADPVLHAIERFEDGTLTEAEALAGIADVVMAGIEAPRYVRISPINFHALGATIEAAVAGTYSRDDCEYISIAQADALNEIRRQVGGRGTVTVRRHTGKVGDLTITRYGALVRIEWYGVTVSREYALPDA